MVEGSAGGDDGGDPRLLYSWELIAKPEGSTPTDVKLWRLEQPLPTSVGGADIGGSERNCNACFASSTLACAARLSALPGYAGVDPATLDHGMFAAARAGDDATIEDHRLIARAYAIFDKQPYYTLRGRAGRPEGDIHDISSTRAAGPYHGTAPQAMDRSAQGAHQARRRRAQRHVRQPGHGRRLALRAKGARARDSTVYGGSSTSAKLFFVHHTQQLAAAAQVGDTKGIRKKITEMKMRLIRDP